MTLTLCVPVLNRYDLLHRLLVSAVASTRPPTSVWILDNGGNPIALQNAISGLDQPWVSWVVEHPQTNLGVAAAWNWFLTAPEDRVIVNDDVVFAPESLARLVDTPGDFVSALGGSAAFSCFLIRDSCVEKVGRFDETISPGYAYFEDNDYAERMALADVQVVDVDAGVTHTKSSTITAYSNEELREHHQRFNLAKANYVKKWGRLPAGSVETK